MIFSKNVNATAAPEVKASERKKFPQKPSLNLAAGKPLSKLGKEYDAVVKKVEAKISERQKLLDALDKNIEEYRKKVEQVTAEADALIVDGDADADAYKANKEAYAEATAGLDLYTQRRKYYENVPFFSDQERKELYETVRAAQDAAVKSTIKRLGPVLKQAAEIGDELWPFIAAGDNVILYLDGVERIFPERARGELYALYSDDLKYKDTRVVDYVEAGLESGWYPEIVNNSFDPV